MTPALVLQCGQRCLHLVHGGDHGPSIGRSRLPEAGLGRRHVVPQAATLEDRRGEVAEQVAEPLVHVEEAVRVGGLDSNRPRKREGREQSARRAPMA